jgi:ribosomal protein S18 acetylase RimI-like enzyme
MELRPVTPEDAKFFYEARKAGFEPYATQIWGPWIESFQRMAASKDFTDLPVQVVEVDGERVGYLIVLHKEDHWDLDEIVVVPEHQCRGLGTQLLRTLMAAAQAAGMPIRLSVLNINPARELYLRLGFRVTRLEPPRVKMQWP